MARIRNIKQKLLSRSIDIKPEFFIDETLQDIEAIYPSFYPMMVFMGLRSLCDVNDRFLWEPALIKTVLYPKIPIEMDKTLIILEENGFIERYTDAKTLKEYGVLIDPENLTRLTRHIYQREEETPGYAEWRLAVLERDLYTCQECGKTGCKFCIHHIKSYKDYPELRIDINNGITLCEDCHKKRHAKDVSHER
jgi:hypothetical protein